MPNDYNSSRRGSGSRRRSRSPRGRAPSPVEMKYPLNSEELPFLRVKEELMPIARYLGISSSIRRKDDLVQAISYELNQMNQSIYLSDILFNKGEEYSNNRGRMGSSSYAGGYNRVNGQSYNRYNF